MASIERVRVRAETVSREYGPDEDAGRNFLDAFREKFRVELQQQTRDEIVFDMVGIDPAIANAFRRILLAEVPSVAIDRVYYENNTSIMQDEVLAHRLAMVPLRVDPAKLQPKAAGDVATDTNTLVFQLHSKWDPTAATAEPGDENRLMHVYSRDLLWQPHGDQAAIFEGCEPRPVHDDILLLKMRPGQEVKLEAHACLGTGDDHAKWSPVATAYYRFHPEVTLQEPVRGPEAEELVKRCPMNVFDIEDSAGTPHATVARPRNCSMCRECVRPAEWDRKIKLARKQHHFIFHVESTGAVPARDLMISAFRRLAEKCRTVHTSLDMVETVGELGTVEEREGAEGGENGEEEDDQQPEELAEEEMVAGDGQDADSDNGDDA